MLHYDKQRLKLIRSFIEVIDIFPSSMDPVTFLGLIVWQHQETSHCREEGHYKTPSHQSLPLFRSLSVYSKGFVLTVGTDILSEMPMSPSATTMNKFSGALETRKAL